MFDLDDLYHIVSADYYELVWQDKNELEGASDTYNRLSAKKQAEFNRLIDKAKDRCSSDFSSFPDSYRTEIDCEIRDQIIGDITKKIESIFQNFLNS